MALVLVLAVVSAFLGLSAAKISQVALSSTTSNAIAIETRNLASSEAELVRAISYSSLASDARTAVSGTPFEREIIVSGETSYSDTIKQRIVTINVYKPGESLARASLSLTRYNVEREYSGVPVGTVITWASWSNPTENGVWLECNGQSCASYPKLVAVLGSNTVPNYTGAFLRSWGYRTSTHYGTVTHSSGALGDLQGDAIRNIYGTVGEVLHGYSADWAGGAFWGTADIVGRTYPEGAYTSAVTRLDASRVVPIANENRPINVAVRYFIKAA